MERQKRLESEERFRRVFDDGPLGMVIFDSSYKIINANKAISKMLGYTEQEIAGRSIEDVTHPEDREKSLELAGQLLSGEIPFF